SPQEFYYQVGDAADHETWRLPEEDCAEANKDWKPRPVYAGVGANLAGRTAAAFALAAQQFRRFDRRYAARCLEAAQSAYALGLQNRRVLTTTPDDFYPEQTWQDDMAWGAAALFQATGRRELLDQALEFARGSGPCGEGTSVYNTHAVAYSTLLPHVSGSDRDRLRDYLRQDADTIRAQAENPYGLGTRYGWGTSEMAAGAALTCLLYAGAATDTDTGPYTAVARRQRDFILGCNPFGLCCLIGAGTRYALYPHHQIANLKGIELRGALIGGPASLHAFRGEKMSLEGVEISSQIAPGGNADALPDGTGVYHDVVENYVANEPANDYTVKFLLLSAFYQDAMENKEIKEI
ncbi:MAG TPA: glycoside hydrolase family 9 protein, partial [Chthonomonadaceae bacterium]|nr:glycoside hydrolase family 9 protein [Chthonomonadaceae bacterium]